MSDPAQSISRRQFVGASTAAALTTGVLGLRSAEASEAVLADSANHQSLSAKALVFDVFGTVVDWRTSVAAEIDALAVRRGLRIDGAQFADAWRAGYGPAMNRVRTAELPWRTLDQLHRVILDKLLVDFGVTGMSEAETEDLNRAWHRLRPWPDSVPGLLRLKAKFTIAPLSNGNIALMTDLAKYSALPWDCVLGAELVRHYKPDPEVYKSSADFLDLRVDQVMMVAAHLGDMRAAKKVGLKTAFVTRPLEYGPTRAADSPSDPSIDLVAKDFRDLASQLGA